jgi:Protein of unknown function (DUF3313)
MTNKTTCCISLATIKRCVLASASLLLSACATTISPPSGFLPNSNALRPSAFENVALYRAPGFDPLAYGHVRLTPSQVYAPSARLRELDIELRQEVLTHLDKELSSRILPGVSGNTKALTVRAVVTDIDTPNRALNVATTLVVGPMTSGGASVEVEIVDENAGTVMFAATCTERGSVLWQFTGAYSVLSHAKYAISECVQRFEQAYRIQAATGAPTTQRTNPLVNQHGK